MKTYRGERRKDGQAMVTVSSEPGVELALDPGFRWVRHSPTGFEWGFAGSGPAQLAFAVLFDHFDGDAGRAMLYYQDFKRATIARIHTNQWQLTSADIEATLNDIRQENARQNPGPGTLVI